MTRQTIQLALPAHGTFTVTPAALDLAIAAYLPASPAGLRKIVEDRTSADYSDVSDVSAFLVMLADFDHNVDDDPTSATTDEPRYLVIDISWFGSDKNIADEITHDRTGTPLEDVIAEAERYFATNARQLNGLDVAVRRHRKEPWGLTRGTDSVTLARFTDDQDNDEYDEYEA